MKRDKLTNEFSAGGIVFRKNKNRISYLLIKDVNNKWTIPKGHIEENENAKTAALREIKEETGLNKLEIVRELEATKYFFCRGKDLIRKTVYLFLIEAESSERLKPDPNEVKAATWFSGKDVIKNVGYTNIKNMLNKTITGGGYK